MPRDIRNIERGACIEGCRSCPNFLSVEPGRVLCDYCGCPPTKHEIIKSHSLLAIHGPEESNMKLNHSKEISRIAQLKNDGLCFTASRTSSNDSGCDMASFSIGSPSTTSASTSSCSPYVSEEEGVDDCFIPEEKKNFDEIPCVTTTSQKDIVKIKSNHECSAGVYNCPNNEMVVKIRSKSNEISSHHHLLDKPIVLNNLNEHVKEHDTNTADICLTSSPNHFKRRTYKSALDIKESSWETSHEKTVESSYDNRKESVNEENSTLQEIGQLEIDEKFTGCDFRMTEKIVENKIIRAEGDYDVSGHHEIMAGSFPCERRSALN